MQVSTTKYQSRVLMSWLVGRAGGTDRAGISAMLPENSSQSSLTVDELARVLGASALSHAGAHVTPETALRVTTVYGCAALITGAVSTLPFGIYERTDDTRKKTKHDYWWMLNEQANDDWTAATAMEYFLGARLFYGDGFARLIRPNAFTNRVTGWRPLHPTRVEPFLNSQNGLRYRITSGASFDIIDPADMLHVPSLGFDGLRSPSPITYAAREAIGTNLAAEEFSARFFAQGSTHDIALQTDKKLNEEQLEVLRKSYQAKYGGGKNSRVPLILSGGLKVEKLSITPQDAALLATRAFTVEEICRVFGVPPFMVGATDKTTSWGSGIEQQGIGFVKYTLRRHLTPIEQEFNRKLWPNRERFFVEYNTAALERGDYKTRMEGYRIGVGRAGEPGWLTPDEVRRLENMEPIEGGDKLHDGGGKPAADDPAMNAMVEGLRANVNALRDRPQEVHHHIDAHTTIAEGAVQFTAGPTHVDARTSIEPGAVQLDAPVTVNNEVQPAEVNVKSYPSETTETFERDDKGELLSATRKAKD